MGKVWRGQGVGGKGEAAALRSYFKAACCRVGEPRRLVADHTKVQVISTGGGVAAGG